MHNFCRPVRIDTLSAIAISTGNGAKPQKFNSTTHRHIAHDSRLWRVFLPHCFVSLAQHRILRHRRRKQKSERVSKPTRAQEVSEGGEENEVQDYYIENYLHGNQSIFIQIIAEWQRPRVVSFLHRRYRSSYWKHICRFYSNLSKHKHARFKSSMWLLFPSKSFRISVVELRDSSESAKFTKAFSNIDFFWCCCCCCHWWLVRCLRCHLNFVVCSLARLRFNRDLISWRALDSIE